MAEEWRELDFADGKRVVDQPYADQILAATHGSPEGVTFKRAMQMINHLPMRNLLRSVERQVFKEHFRQFGD